MPIVKPDFTPPIRYAHCNRPPITSQDCATWKDHVSPLIFRCYRWVCHVDRAWCVGENVKRWLGTKDNQPHVVKPSPVLLRGCPVKPVIPLAIDQHRRTPATDIATAPRVLERGRVCPFCPATFDLQNPVIRRGIIDRMGNALIVEIRVVLFPARPLVNLREEVVFHR